MSYTRTRAWKAFAQTNHFWSINQAWSLIVPVLVGLAVTLRALFLKIGFVRASNETFYAAAATAGLYGVLVAIAVYVIGWISTFVANFIWAAPAELHKEQLEQIKKQAATIEEQVRLIEQERKRTAPRMMKETPAGEMNSLNRDFTLTYAPNPPSSLDVWLNGLEQARYCTLNGRVVTFRVAPKKSDHITARYTY